MIDELRKETSKINWSLLNSSEAASFSVSMELLNSSNVRLKQQQSEHKKSILTLLSVLAVVVLGLIFDIQHLAIIFGVVGALIADVVVTRINLHTAKKTTKIHHDHICDEIQNLEKSYPTNNVI
jgi:hypothetical protein